MTLSQKLLDLDDRIDAIETWFIEEGNTLPKAVLEIREKFDKLLDQEITQEEEIAAIETLVVELERTYLDS